MMTKFLVTIGYAILLFGRTTVVQASDWQEFKYPEDGFTIFAPVKPALSKQSFENEKDTTEAHLYSFATDDQGIFLMVVVNLPSNDARSDQQVLERARNMELKASNGRLVSQSTITVGNHRGLEIELVAPDAHSKKGDVQARFRYLVVGHRLFQMMSTAPTGKRISANTDRWFQSFNLLSESVDQKSH
jgi:hypothetical protein